MTRKPVKVGTYDCGYERIDLYLRPGRGGNGRFPHSGLTVVRIEIGADQEHWVAVLRCLLHEVFEVAMCREGCRFEEFADFSDDSGNCIFLMRHDQFSRVCANAGEFLRESLPDAAEAYQKWRTQTLRKRKAKK